MATLCTTAETERQKPFFIDSLRQMAAHYNMLWLAHLRDRQNDDIYGYQPTLDLSLDKLAGYLAPECDHWTAERTAIVPYALQDRLAPLAALLADGRGVGVLVHGESAKVIGLADACSIDKAAAEMLGAIETFMSGKTVTTEQNELQERVFKAGIYAAAAYDAHTPKSGGEGYALRYSAAGELAEAGCTDHQIAAITGHNSLSMIQKYSRGANQKILAKQAQALREQNKNKT
ncbi:hypothetical protein [Pseudophaeobacter sp.]|uniref:hypothetical protein n=1 Tax=Pseudophaeobacter sp. TaxID=1971739 RepID=UPI0032999749